MNAQKLNEITQLVNKYKYEGSVDWILEDDSEYQNPEEPEIRERRKELQVFHNELETERIKQPLLLRVKP